MEEVDNNVALLKEAQVLHQRAVTLWNDKQKYLASMRKSTQEIHLLSQKNLNEERRKLMGKLNGHISRVMGEYIPVTEELSIIRRRANQVLSIISASLDNQQALPAALQIASIAQEIDRINADASDFSNIGQKDN